MKKVKTRIPAKLRKGIPLKTGPNHTVRLEVTNEALTVHTGLSLFYAMAEALEIPRALNEQVKVKQRELGYPESEHILALAANAFAGGDYLEDLEALRNLVPELQFFLAGSSAERLPIEIPIKETVARFKKISR